jgi:GTP-binding protein
MEYKFVDETLIEVHSGDGGSGAVHFRREKFVPRGGPDGGDGGDGGDALFVVRRNLKTLSSLKMRRVFRAGNGRPGGAKGMHGRRGEDVEIAVPPGTILREADTGQVLKDLAEEAEPWVFLKGGRGGRGNARFATATRQAPRFSEPGREGQSASVRAELALIADVGLVGKPNAGKSTLLSVLTNSRPKIAAYPFTTRTPNIGVLTGTDELLLLADIPGIIEGAAQGAGLGLRFLRHLGRTRLLAFLIDLGEPSPAQSFDLLLRELRAYGQGLADRPRLIVGTKLDLPEAQGRLEELGRELPEENLLGVSALTSRGIAELRDRLLRLVHASR